MTRHGFINYSYLLKPCFCDSRVGLPVVADGIRSLEHRRQPLKPRCRALDLSDFRRKSSRAPTSRFPSLPGCTKSTPWWCLRHRFPGRRDDKPRSNCVLHEKALERGPQEAKAKTACGLGCWRGNAPAPPGVESSWCVPSSHHRCHSTF